MKPATPLPWAIDSNLPPNDRPVILRTTSVQIPISGNQHGPLPIPGDAQNAAYIVHAANLYPELVEALEAASALIATARRYFPKSMHSADRFSLETTCAIIGTALHKAKG